ncbi:Calcium influx-promoting protein ehs1 [Sphaceloma murrayae]|uniref:Calcium influx-promoting protein ehs1 n=1 Tax=Sphaceloma murrayae TaxID=2082308 RepID=A0A2K1QFH8_9PEZI|nr:Calcium influx-promoting protein ehs1 [Sphaceloma murrayae]
MHIQCPRLPKLTQLQSRFAASLGASLLLLALYFILSSPRLAYAAELELPSDTPQEVEHYWWGERSVGDAEDNRPAWDGGSPIDPWDEELGGMVEDFGLPPPDGEQQEVMAATSSADGLVEDVENWFKGRDTASENKGQDQEDRSELKRRQATTTASIGTGTSPTPLPGNNSPGRSNIAASQVHRWIFPSDVVQGPSGIVGRGLPGGFKDFEDQSMTHEERERHKELQQEELEKRKRQNQQTVFISINTCTQPSWTGRGNRPDTTPQLTLFMSSTSAQVGAANPPSDQIQVLLEEGFASANITATQDVFIGVGAPNLPNGWTGSWTYSVAASIDDYYYTANFGLPPLYLVDTDTESALFVTDNVTQANATSEEFTQWAELDPPPFTLFAQSNATSDRIAGMRYSYCGLSNAADLQANQQTADAENAPVQMSMVTRGLGNKPKQQFYVRGLNGSSDYQVILAMDGNSTASGAGVIGGGGRVYTSTNFTTKSDGNCALLFSLPFCSSTAYAVPSNPFTFPNTTSLTTFYDTYARDLYTNFTLSLQLVPCNTSSTSRYSLAQTCDDCARAYKEWLCAVTIPRCEDYSSSLSHLQRRNVGQPFFANDSFLPDSVLGEQYNPMQEAPRGSNAQQQVLGRTFAANQSRNARIDALVRPGPYKELLPCEDLCFDLVRSCPSALGFGCPQPGRGLEAGYGKRDGGVGVRCSFAGAVYQVAAAGRVGTGRGMAVLVACVVALGLLW